MTTATITSKNQITIPVEIVRQLKLGKSRRLTVEKRGDEIVLKPEQELQDRFQELWARNQSRIKVSLSDEALKKAKHDAWEEHVDQKVKRWREQGSA